MALEAILDTRFYFSYFNPESEEVASWSRELIRRASRGEVEVASSAVTIAELYGTMGRALGKDVVKMRITSIKASNVKILPVNERVASLAGEIALDHPEIPLADAIIAATALIHAKSTVITDDEHFKEIKGLKVKWLK